MSAEENQFDELGSLAQSARTKQLKTARGILFFVGVLTVIVNAYFVANAESLVKEEFEKEKQQLRNQGMEIDMQLADELEAAAVQTTRLINGGAVALGFVFIVFGCLLYRFPVPITITSLILYIGSIAVFAVIEPLSLVNGIIMKVIIIFCLVNAVKAAFAYEKELKLRPTTDADLGDAVGSPAAEF